MKIILTKGVHRGKKKLPIGTRMEVTAERFAELGDAVQAYHGPMVRVKNKPRTELFKPKEELKTNE